MSLVDALVVMDDVQYDRRYTNRNRILAPQGPIWLTVPIVKSQKFMRNMDVEVNNALPWREEHWKKISYSYRNAKWFRTYEPDFERVYQSEHRKLLDLDLELTLKSIGWLSLKTEVIMESELGVKGSGTERLVNACLAVGADTYVSGPGGKGYMDESLFEAGGVALEYQRYRPRPYRQRFSDGFVPDLSIVDMLFNMGPGSRELIFDGSGSG